MARKLMRNSWTMGWATPWLDERTILYTKFSSHND